MTWVKHLHEIRWALSKKQEKEVRERSHKTSKMEVKEEMCEEQEECWKNERGVELDEMETMD